MSRITRKVLQSRVDYLNKILGFEQGGKYCIELDHHQPGGNMYTWKVILGQRRELQNGKYYYLETQSIPGSDRTNASGCYDRLNGMIWGIEHALCRGDFAYQIEEPNTV